MWTRVKPINNSLKESAQKAWPEMEYIFDMFDEIDSK
jgi:hypothetical protein